MPTPPDRWLPLEEPQITPEGRWESKARFEPSSLWFSGHFEEFPLLPGVALLALASETLKKQALKNDRLLDISGFSKVRFRQIVLPGEELLISVGAMPNSHVDKLDFQITCQGRLVAHGFLKVHEAGLVRMEELNGESRDLFDGKEKMAEEELFPAESLIPHSHHMRLLEWVKKPVEKTLLAVTTVKADWPLHRDGMVSVVLSVELVAQAIAALRTWRQGKEAKSRPGFIVGVKEADFSRSSFSIGTRLFIRIAEIYNFGEYAVYEGQVSSLTDFTCKTAIQVMEPEEKDLSALLARQKG